MVVVLESSPPPQILHRVEIASSGWHSIGVHHDHVQLNLRMRIHNSQALVDSADNVHVPASGQRVDGLVAPEVGPGEHDGHRGGRDGGVGVFFIGKVAVVEHDLFASFDVCGTCKQVPSDFGIELDDLLLYSISEGRSVEDARFVP